MGFRVILSPLLEKWGVFYLLNVAISIGIAASLDFILYEKLAFRRGDIKKRFAVNIAVAGPHSYPTTRSSSKALPIIPIKDNLPCKVL
jgi:hypothetical protein